MNKSAILLALVISLIALAGFVQAITPTLTLSMNANGFAGNTAASNQIATATCTGGDTCQVWANGGVASLASGTTTATLNVNTLLYNTNGYNGLYANDITTPANSITNTLRLFIPTNNVKVTVNNIQATPIALGTTLEADINPKAFSLYETTTTANNIFLYTTTGIVCPVYFVGNQINQSNPKLQFADEVDIEVEATAQCLTIPKTSTNTIIIGYTAPGKGIWDGNFVGGNPALSQYNTGSPTAGDDGNSVYEEYISFAGFSSNTVNPAITANAVTIINNNNFTEFKSTGSTWGSVLQASPATVKNAGNAMDILGDGELLFGTTGDSGSPDAHANKAVEVGGTNCLDSGNLCTNIGGGFAGINALTSEYTYENPPAYIPSCTLTNSIFPYLQTLGQLNNFWQGSPIVASINPLPFTNGKTSDLLGGTNTPTSNVPNLPFYKIVFADNISNVTTEINYFQRDNVSGKGIIVYDLENATTCSPNPGASGGVCTPAWEQIYIKPAINNFCDIVHAAGFLCGITIEVLNGQGVYSAIQQLSGIDYASVDFYDLQIQVVGTPNGGAYSSAANAFIFNTLKSGTNSNLHFTGQISTNNEQTGSSSPLSNAITSRQAMNFTKLINAQGLMVNFFPTDACNTSGCTNKLVANDMEVFSSYNTVFNPNNINVVSLYSLTDANANTLIEFNNQFVQARTGTSGITANDFGFWLPNGAVANVFAIDQRIEPQNGIMPYWTLNTTGAITTPTIAGNVITVGTTTKIIENVNFTGGMYPYTYNWIATNSVTGVVIANVLVKGVNATWFGFPYVWNTINRFNNITFTPVTGNTYNINAVVTDALGVVVNSPTYYYGGVSLPGAKISVTNTVVDAGQFVVWTGQTAAGTYYSYSSNILFNAFNTVTGSSINTISFNNIQTVNDVWSWQAPNIDAGNVVTANIAIFGWTGNFISQTTASSKTNSVMSQSVTINPTLLDSWTAANNPAPGGIQTLTATTDGGSGTQPYTYNMLVYNAVGSLVFNSLSTATSSTSNVVSFTQQATWGTGTFTANVFIKDSASTPVTISNTLTYTVSGSSLASTGFTASNTVTDQNNYQVLTATVSGGTTPYNYNYLIYNSVGLVTNALYNGNSITSNTFEFQISSSWGTGTFTANLVVKDSASGTVSNTLTFTVDTALNANPPTPTAANIDNGQSITLTSSPTGGTGTYTAYQWYTDSGNNCVSLSIIGGATSSTYVASPTSNTFYCYIVTDSALGTATSSAPANIIVYATLGTNPSLTLSNTIIDQGQSILFTATSSGGSSPYTYNFQIVNSITGNTIANQLYKSVISTTNTYFWTPPANIYTANTFKANIVITDSAFSPVTVNSVYNAFTYNGAFSAGGTSWAVQPGIDAGQEEVMVHAGTGGGTGPFFFTYNVYNSITNVVIFTGTTGSGQSSFGFQQNWFIPLANAGNTAYYNAVVIDSASTPVTSNSIHSITITINSPMGTPSITTPIPSSQQSGNVLTFTTTLPANAGTPPYTYNWIIINTITQTVFANMLVTNSFTGNTFKYTVLSGDVGNTIEANVTIKDSGAGISPPFNNIVNSVYSGTLTLVSAPLPLQPPTLTLSNTLIDQGQSILFTATVSGGTSTYTYNYQIVNSITGVTIVNQLYTGVSSTVNSFFWTPPSKLFTGNTFKANVIVTDSSPTTLNSVYSPIGYNALPHAYISASNAVLSSGQFTTYTVSIVNGTGPFNVAIYNISSSGQQGANIIVQRNGSNSIMQFQVSSPTNSNTFQFNAVATDYGTTTNQIIQSNPITNTITVAIQPDQPVFTPDGSIMYVPNYQSDIVSVINTATNSVINTITVGVQPNGAAINPSGTILYIANGGSGTVSVINIATNIIIHTITTGSSPTGIAFNPSGTLAYVTNYGSGTVNVINVATNTIINTITVGTAPVMVTFSPLGNIAYVVNNGGTTAISVINVATNTVINTISTLTTSTPNYVAFNPSGTLAYLSLYASGTINVINVATNTVINTIFINTTGPTGIAFNPSGTLAYVSQNFPGAISVINVATNTIINTTSLGSKHVSPPSFKPSTNLAYESVFDAGNGAVNVVDVSYIILVNMGILTPTLSASNTLLDSGQFTTLTGVASGGAPPYTYTFENTTSGSAIPISACNGSSTTCTFTVSSPTQSNVFTYNLLVTDTGLNTANSITSSISVNEPLNVSLSPGANAFIIGNTQIMTATVTPGQGPYTYNWIVSNTAGFFSNALYKSNSFTQNKITFTPLAIGTYNVNVVVTDSATSPSKVTTSNSIIMVANSVLVPILSPQSAVISALQSQVFTGTWFVGPAPYTATLKTFAAANCIVGGATVQTIPGISGTSTSFNPVAPLSQSYYCLFVTDGVGNTLNSTPSVISISGILPVNTTSGNVPIPFATANCILLTGPPNSVSCSGYDKNNVIALWTISIFNSSGFAGKFLINTKNFTSNSFIYSNSPVYPSNPISWLITASSNKTGFLSWQGTFASNLHATSYYTPLNTLLTVVFILIGIAAGSNIIPQHKLSTTMFITGLIITFEYLVGLTQWLGIAINAALILFCVVIGILGYVQENKSLGGG